MSSRPLVEVSGLTRYFDVSKPFLNRIIEGGQRQYLRAVNDVSLTINEGETFALVGESGCGKSTVARLIAGLIPPSSGSVNFDGTDVFASRRLGDEQRLRRRFQMIFQDPYASLNPRWRVDRIVAEPIRVFGLARGDSEVERRVAKLLALVGLAPSDGRKYPHEFSGGQRQRIAIARALSNNPDFVICDEPTSALDVSVQAQILNLMRDLQAELGLTFLFISHDLAVVRHMATHVGVMYLGELVEVAPAGNLFDAAHHPYTRMLLDAVPDMEMAGRERSQVRGEVPNPIHPPPGCSFHPRCPVAMGRCSTEAPALRRVALDHETSCHAVAEGRI